MGQDTRRCRPASYPPTNTRAALLDITPIPSDLIMRTREAKKISFLKNTIRDEGDTICGARYKKGLYNIIVAAPSPWASSLKPPAALKNQPPRWASAEDLALVNMRPEDLWKKISTTLDYLDWEPTPDSEELCKDAIRPFLVERDTIIAESSEKLARAREDLARLPRPH